MPDAEPSSLDRLGRWLAIGLAAIHEAARTPERTRALLAELGFEPPSDLVAFGLDQRKLTALADAVHGLHRALIEQRAALTDYAAATAAAGVVVADIAALGRRLPQLLDPAYVNGSGIADNLPRRLLDWALLEALRRTNPVVPSALAVVGLVETSAPVGAPEVANIRRTRPELLPRLITDPGAALTQLYGWGTGEPRLDRAVTALFELGLYAGRAFDLTYSLDSLRAWMLDDDVVDLHLDHLESRIVESEVAGVPVRVGARLYVADSVAGKRTALALGPYIEGDASVEVPIDSSGAWTLAVDGALGADAEAVLLRPGPQGRGAVVELLGEPSAGARLRFVFARARPDGGRQTVFEIPGVVRVQAGRVAIVGAIEAATDGFEAYVELGVIDGLVEAATGAGDGFLKSVLPNAISTPFEVGVRASSRRGITITGTGALSSKQPLNLRLGPVELLAVELALVPVQRALGVRAAFDARVSIGPVAATVEGVGAAVRLDTRDGMDGNAGVLDVGAAFVPPRGVALAVDHPPVTGGGFLRIDHEQGRYLGAVQLKVGGVSVAAVGLLTTKLPGAEPGYSLLVLISARFAPVQLGFGFALTAVGGLIGINRSVAVEPLRQGLAQGSLDAVLLPADLQTRPEKVVGELERFFPVAPDQHVVGPTAEVVWGEGEILTATIGLFLELPSPVRVLLAGRVRLALPKPDAAVVDIRLDVLGVLDFAAKQLAIDAVLRNSRVAAFALNGEAALRASWGKRPAFLLAAGGFHPRFEPPASFPPLRRMTLALGDSANPRVRLESYLALTSNTAQVGARLEVYAAVDVPIVGKFAVDGRLGFDALFEFEPFRFEADIVAMVQLTWDGDPFLGIRLDIRLSGPRPWHAAGKATFRVFGSTRSIQFKLTIGEAARALPEPTVDVLAELIRAFGQPASWTADAPAGGDTLVTLAGGGAAAAPGIAAHPLGSLTVIQRVAPLGIDLARIGSSRIAGTTRRFAITATTLGPSTERTPVTDHFAAAQFLDLTDEEKLARPSFQLMDAGARLVPPATTAPQVARWGRRANAQLVTHVLAPDPVDAARRMAGPPVSSVMGEERVLRQVPSAAVAVAGSTSQGAAAYASVPVGVAVAKPTYAVVSADTLDPVRVDGRDLAFLPSFAAADEERRRRGGALAIVETADAYARTEPVAPPDVDPLAFYRLVAAHSGKALEVRGASLADGARVEQSTRDADGNQFWRFVPFGDGTHTIVAEHSGKVLDAVDSSSTAGTPIQQRQKAGTPSQRWRVAVVAVGRYRIESVNGGRCLEVAGGPGATANGAAAQLGDWVAGTNQLWQLERVPAGQLLHEEVERRAYMRWLARGRPLWRALDDWWPAEREILEPHIRLAAYARYERRGRAPGRAVEDWLAAERDLRRSLDPLATGGVL